MLQVKLRRMKDLITVFGALPEVKAGEWIDAEGRWVIDRELQRPSFPELRLDDPLRLGTVRGRHMCRVPFQVFAHAQGEIADKQ